MKFSLFKEFRSYSQDLISDVNMYLRDDVKKIIRELQLGLTRLSFSDNFNSFIVEVDMPATTEVAIRNQLQDAGVPSQRIILRGGDGTQNITDGVTEWDQNYVYLKNQGATAVTITVAFLK